MSSGPTLTGETCIEVTKRTYINMQFDVEDWCTYEGECKKYLMLFQDDVCLFCKYRKPLDIPAMINARLEERK